MPKNKGKGGRGFRKGKHENFTKRLMIYRASSQAYAKVTKMLGNGRVCVECFIENEKKEFRIHECLGIIRGSMRKRVWISPEDIVIAEIREFQTNKVDIVYKYEPSEVKILLNKNALPNNSGITFNIMDNNEDEEIENDISNDIGIVFDKNEPKSIRYEDLVLIPDENELSDTEIEIENVDYNKQTSEYNDRYIEDI